MKCEVEGWPKPTVSWELNMNKIQENEKYQVNQENGDLNIIKVSDEDQGMYRCGASNDDTDAGITIWSAEGELIVKDVTTIVTGITDMDVEVHSEVRMDCVVVYDFSQNDSFSVSWQKNGEPLEVDGEVIAGLEGQYGIVIRNVTMEDEGVYTCSAKTISSQDSDTGKLVVIGIPPRLKNSGVPKTVATVTEEDLILHCDFVEPLPFPVPNVSWYRDEIISSLPLGEKYSVCSHNMLTIKNVSKDDADTYRCRAKNEFGEDAIVVSLNVWRRTVIDGVGVDYMYNEGDEVMFNCDHTVGMELEMYKSVAWVKDDKKLFLPIEDEDDGSGFDPIVYEEGAEIVPEVENATVCEGDMRGCLVLFSNGSLKISDMIDGNVGKYKCVVTINEPSFKRPHVVEGDINTIYVPFGFPWWIILIIVIVFITFLIILIICLCCCCCGKKKSKTPLERSIIKDPENPEFDPLLPNKPLPKNNPDDVLIQNGSAPTKIIIIPPDDNDEPSPSTPNLPPSPHPGRCSENCYCPKRTLSFGDGSGERLTLCDFQTKNMEF
jgi:hypothetical protein